MDGKEIRSNLKHAREAIKNKEFKDALKYCKSVLAHDKNNYNALVFIGVAAEGMEQPEQAVKAFKRAIETAPEQILAWQGLCSFYEKNPTSDNDSDLVNVYQRLQELYDASGDTEKRNETLCKLAQLDIKIGAQSMAVHIYKCRAEEEKDPIKKLGYQKDLIQTMLLDKHFSEEDEKLFINTCEEIFETPNNDLKDTEFVCQVYIDNIIKNLSIDEVQLKCKHLHEKIPTAACPLEYLIIMYLDRHISSSQLTSDSEFEHDVEELKQISDSSSVVKAAEGYIFLCQRDFLKARNLLKQASDELKKMVSVHFFLAMSLLYLHDYTGAENSCKMCLNLLQKKDRMLTVKSTDVRIFIQILQVKLLNGLGTKQSLDMALDIISQISEYKTDETNVLAGHIYVKLGDLSKAQEYLDKDSETPDMIALCGWVDFKNGNFNDADVRLQKAVNMDSLSSQYHLMLARALWEIWLRDKQKTTGEQCYTTLLKAARLDPYYSDTFLYLGHFYNLLQKDETKARKCYQKSFDLNENNDEAGAALCDLMTSSDRHEEAYDLLVSVTSKASAGCAKWAWLRLGLHQLKHEDISASISSFQSALRADPRESHVWECLAEAYQQRGSYTAALKAFTKAAELNPDSLYCLFQISAIKQTLGEYSDAIAEYKLILDREANYVPALKGLGETYLLLARSHLSKFFNGRGRDNCQDALMYLTRAVLHRPDLSCLWKLMGDACTMIHPLPNSDFSMTVPLKLMEKTISHSEMCSLNKIQTLELGARCYGKAVTILPECAALWHDLGVNLFYQLKYCQTEKVPELSEKSMNSLRKALSLDPSNYKHWNALGVVSSSEYVDKKPLAQHCFIKSIQTEANNVLAWTNLATLYLKNDNIGLAHEAFKVAQSLEPSYVACWIGQAIIAETVGDEDAMDLFRHTTELATHIEGAVGYAHWVCSMLQDTSKQNSDMFTYAIQQMAAIPAASDALARYLDRIKTDSTAYNMYGMLLEHQNLYRSAATAYKSAVDIIKSDTCGYSDEQLIGVRINYARILCNLCQYEDALSLYHDVGDHLTRLEDICCLGLTLLKSGQYKESYQAYTKAHDMCETDEDRSHVLSALGMVAYKFGDIEGAKSMLLQGSQLSTPSSNGLQALCALGILQSDATLTMAVLQELFKHGGQESQSATTAHLMAMSSCIMEKNWKAAHRYIQQCIHKDPSQASMWKLLSLILLRHCPNSGAAAASCAKSSLALDLNACEASTLETTGHLYSGLQVTSKLRNQALVSAQIAVHHYPERLENWYNLTSAVHGTAVLETNVEKAMLLHDTVITLSDWLVQNDAPSLGLHIWCQKHRVISLMLNRKEDIKTLLKQMIDDSGEEIQDIVSLVTKIIDGNMSKLKDDLSCASDKLLHFQILLEMSSNTEFEGLLQSLNFEELGSNSKEAYIGHLYRAFYIYKHLMVDDSEALSNMFNESVTVVLQYNPHCSPVKLMQAGVNLQSNTRLAKRYLLQVNDDQFMQPISGHDVSVARRCLLHLLCSLKKESSQDLMQIILKQASNDEDNETLQFYETNIAGCSQ